MVVRKPLKRSGHGDKVSHKLEYFSFLDDRRSFANVDALLTRFAPVSTVYVACTESLDDNNNNESSSAKSKRSAAEVAKVVQQLVHVIESRVDVSESNVNDGDDDNGSMTVNVLPNLSKAKASSLAEQCLKHLLGGETSEAHLAYRGDKRMAEEPMVSWCLGHLFNADRSLCDESDDSEGSCCVVSGTLHSHLALDRTASEAIHLFPPRNGSGAALLTGGNSSNNSLYGVLNQCQTKMGSRTLEVWLRQPCVELKEIMRRQEVVAKLVEDSIGRDRLREEGLAAFRGLDIDALGYKLDAVGRAAREGGNLGSTSKALECLYKLHLFADNCLPTLLDSLEALVPSDEGQQHSEGSDDTCALSSCFKGLTGVMNHLGKAVELAEKVIDFNAAPRDFIIKPDLDENLHDIKNELDGVQGELEAIHEEMNEIWADVSGQGNNQVRLEDVDSNSNTSCVWQFRLPKTNDAKLLEKELKDRGVKIHRILKNGVYFSTKELTQLGTKKKDLMTEYEEKQRDMVIKCMAVASTYVPVLESASSLLAELDVLASFASVAAYSSSGYCRPEMTDGEEDGLGITVSFFQFCYCYIYLLKITSDNVNLLLHLQLEQARHPCVELQDDMNFIANDFNLTFGESSYLIVTGPNMGGKSTYIRSLGAIVTMAQIGSFVPCSSAKINIVHHILARVGAGDAQDRGISTFMAEMLEASSILRTSTKRSLIVIDELGRGTSTFDGFGLAKAISEHIVQKIGCMTVFATHFHELTALEEQEASVTNCHVTAHGDKQNGLTFLYEVRPGPCLESFGIQVAEMADMPASIIANAKRKAKQLENFDYRKRTKDADREDNVVNHDASERTAAAMKFLCKFKQLPIDKMGKEDLKKSIMPLLQHCGFGPNA